MTEGLVGKGFDEASTIPLAREGAILQQALKGVGSLGIMRARDFVMVDPERGERMFFSDHFEVLGESSGAMAPVRRIFREDDIVPSFGEEDMGHGDVDILRFLNGSVDLEHPDSPLITSNGVGLAGDVEEVAHGVRLFIPSRENPDFVIRSRVTTIGDLSRVCLPLTIEEVVSFIGSWVSWDAVTLCLCLLDTLGGGRIRAARPVEAFTDDLGAEFEITEEVLVAEELVLPDRIEVLGFGVLGNHMARDRKAEELLDRILIFTLVETPHREPPAML